MQHWQALGYVHPDEMFEIAAVAEEAGFEGLLLSDHVFVPEERHSDYPYSETGDPDFPEAPSFPDAFMVMAVLAQHTTRLRFATNVYIMPLRHPVEIAKFIGSAAVFSKNRAVLGVGAGWMKDEFDVLGRVFEKRGARMDEQIHVIRKLLSGEIVEHEGAHFTFPAMQMQPAPTRRVPIWMGGQNEAALRRAGQLSDGWSGSGHDYAGAKQVLERIAEFRRQAGRIDQPFDAIVPFLEVPTDDERKHLVELGMTGTVSYPFPYTVGADARLPEKLDYLRRYGDEVIAKDLA
ncbi:MAG: TIGR03619 family F420-dependent LLM class oxidoreductase [bacterium]|nr:LLM class F420-dependent oxidoreductase [Deltaproteobacteria bacterium]MCP4904329.1 TIGR03619 family F420-dependent LLM class oxidoreductase [bacterium]